MRSIKHKTEFFRGVISLCSLAYFLCPGITLTAQDIFPDNGRDNLVKRGDVLKDRSDNNDRVWREGGYYSGFSPEDEIIEKRTRTTKHFNNSDGSKSLITGALQHYKDEKGKWREIDLDIVEQPVDGYGFVNRKHEIKSFFPSTSGTQGIKIAKDNYSLDFWIKPSISVVDKAGNKVYHADIAQEHGTIQNGKLIYKEVYPGMDEEFQILKTGIKNDIIVNYLDQNLISNSSGNIQFSQSIILPEGFSVWKKGEKMDADFIARRINIRKENSDKGFSLMPIIIYDYKIDGKKAKFLARFKLIEEWLNGKKGKFKTKAAYKKQLEKLSMQDRAYLENNIAVSYYNVKMLGKSINISFNVPLKWLTNQNRSFPVTIDPTVVVGLSGAGWAYPPYTINWNYARTQVIYTSSELGFNGDITKLEFWSNGASADQLNNSTQWLKDVSISAYPAGSGWDASGTVVYNGNISIPATNNWVGPTNTTTFTHNNSSNLQFSYRHEDGSYESSYSTYDYGVPGALRTRFGASDGSNPPNTSAYDASLLCRITYNSSCGNGNCDPWEDCSSCATDCGNCGVAGDAYGVFSPAALGGNVTDCEIYAVEGTGGTAYLVANPNDDGYTNVIVSSYHVVDVDNTSCTNTNTSHATASASPSWTNFGSGSSPASGGGSPLVTQYSTTGRKTVDLTADGTIDYPSQTYTASPGAAIPDNSCTGVTNTINVSGYAGTVSTSGISVKINVTHTWSHDLLIYLTAPNGNILNLMFQTNVAGANLTNTVFSDAGATKLYGNGTSPWTGTWKVEDKDNICGYTRNRPTFGAISGGSYNPNGNWELYILDGLSSDVGTFDNWSITFPAYSVTGSIANTYTDFNNMIISSPSPGSVTASETGMCSGETANFESSLTGYYGYTYLWSIPSPPAGGTIDNIAPTTGSSTDITLSNSTAGDLVFTVNLTVSSECCGTLAPVVTKNITVYANPVAPTASAQDGTPCTGGDDTFEATAPSGANFAWYDASSGGSLLGTGATYDITGVTSGANSVWVEAIDANGCIGSRTQVTTTGTDVSAPTANDGSACAPGDVTMSVNSVANAISYNWYSGSCGGTLEQSGPSLSYTTNVPVISTETYYVSVTLDGCDESACATVTAEVTGAPGTATWTGAASTDWFDAANWDITCAPGCVTDVTIPSAPGNQPVIDFNASSSPAQCKDITLDNGSSLTFDSKGELNVCGDFYHNGTLTMSSKGKVVFIGGTDQNYINDGGSGDFFNVVVNTTSLTIVDGTGYGSLSISSDGIFNLQNGKVHAQNTLSVIIKNTSTSALSGHSASNYFTGRITRYVNATGSYDFPVGNSDAYQLLNLDLTSKAGLTYITAQFGNYTYTTGTGLPINVGAQSYDAILNNGGTGASTGHTYGGVWTVTPDAGSADYSITLYGRNYDNMGAGEAHVVKRSTFCPGVWALAGTFASSTDVSNVVTCSSTSVSGFSHFAVAKNEVPLPVEILSISSNCDRNSVTINWLTASEENNDYFTIERSLDGDDFSQIGEVNGAGNSNVIISYEFNDDNFPGELCYYRLSQTDFDGISKNIGIIAVDCSNRYEFELIAIQPNPTKGDVTVLFYAKENDKVNIKLFDARNRLVLSDVIKTINGVNIYKIEISKYDVGVYFLKLSNNFKTFHEKVVKMN